jgi:replicative DNA helicase
VPPPDAPPEEPETPPEDEPTPPPQLHDLRESGALEQDANAVCFIHHPFDLATNPEKREHGPFSFIIAAQRLGPKGTVKLYADRKYSRFAEVD